jgi:hypothetical protein
MSGPASIEYPKLLPFSDPITLFHILLCYWLCRTVILLHTELVRPRQSQDYSDAPMVVRQARAPGRTRASIRLQSQLGLET